MRGNMTVHNHYTTENTSGYSADQLAEANRRLSDAYSEITDDDDGQILKQLAGDILTDYDTELSSLAPRWTLAPGRTLCCDGIKVGSLVAPPDCDEGVGARIERTNSLDDLAHLLCALLEAGQEDLPVGAPYAFPVPHEVVRAARLVTGL